jgi:hypothetical protein
VWLQRPLGHVGPLTAEDGKGLNGFGERIRGRVVIRFGQQRTECRYLRLVSAGIQVGEVVSRDIQGLCSRQQSRTCRIELSVHRVYLETGTARGLPKVAEAAAQNKRA